MKMFKVDGNSHIRVEDGQAYAVWRVATHDGHLVTGCYGPKSLAAAQALCDLMNEKGSCLQPDFSKVMDSEGADK